jgi:hypothetical protein
MNYLAFLLAHDDAGHRKERDAPPANRCARHSARIWMEFYARFRNLADPIEGGFSTLGPRNPEQIEHH